MDTAFEANFYSNFAVTCVLIQFNFYSPKLLPQYTPPLEEYSTQLKV